MHISLGRTDYIQDLYNLRKKVAKNLTYLSIAEKDIEDLYFLKRFKNLKHLTLNRNYIRDIDLSAIGSLTKLKFLSLDYLNFDDNRKIEDYSPLSNLINLKELHIRGNKIEDISFVRKLINLKTLLLAYNKIEDISPVKKLAKLKVLGLTDNKVKDISALKNLEKLTDVGLDFNYRIEDVSVFNKKHKNIGYLNLCQNKIEDISSFKHLKSVHTLDLGSNRVKDIHSLKELKKLGVIQLGNNRIKDASPLKNLVDTIIQFSLDNNRVKKSKILEIENIVRERLSKELQV